MSTTGHIYRDSWYSGQRCHCCNLTDADHAARQSRYAVRATVHDWTWTYTGITQAEAQKTADLLTEGSDETWIVEPVR